MHCNASSQVSSRTAKGGQVSRLWAAVVAWLRPAAATPEWVQADMTAVVQQFHGEAIQIAGSDVSQAAGDHALQRAAADAAQAAGNDALQVAGDSAYQFAGLRAVQKGGYHTRQVAGDYAYQLALGLASQTAGDYSIQVVGNDSFQVAGIGTQQLTHWYFADTLRTATRVVTAAEAGKRYHVYEGAWTPMGDDPRKSPAEAS